MKLRAGSKALIREINVALVLDVVRAQEPVARAVIAAATGLSPATVTGITHQLLQSGLLTETTEADVRRGTGGRPARLLRLGRNAVFAAGVRLAASEAVVVLVDLGGDVVDTHRETLDSTDPARATAAIARGVVKVAASRPMAELLGVGVAVTGIVDHSGVVRHSGSLGWEDVPLRQLLRAGLDAPVVISSYVDSLASGELLFDARLEARDVIVFSVGASLGASVVVQGRIHRGFDGAAGGFAHWRASSASGDRRPCHCGAVDCIETWSSGWGIEREFERLGMTAATAPAEVRHDVYAAAADRLGVAMANACKMFGPERVLVTFTSEADREMLAEHTERVFAEEFAHEIAPAPAFDLTSAEDAAIGRGVACVVLGQMFRADLSLDSAFEPRQAAR
ncbi:Sugar kinase of the NBD/HSP70 family, may contain an N-terminal HTH domain [Jiangella alba]|uniref:Sugar kinase of the NBD/HSP70 family, may contain an N-terminal HTH domain n=2 Tax=Jiangella alba TaxID=561176 RepID=A0A1H5JD08_9ACTN|nr:Sugar kinase of the NBD/HSP70 family, may contain an N-terminal HTH domain [Jiangella alba]